MSVNIKAEEADMELLKSFLTAPEFRMNPYQISIRAKDTSSDVLKYILLSARYFETTEILDLVDRLSTGNKIQIAPLSREVASTLEFKLNKTLVELTGLSIEDRTPEDVLSVCLTDSYLRNMANSLGLRSLDLNKLNDNQFIAVAEPLEEGEENND